MTIGNQQMSRMTDDIVFTILGCIAVAEAVVLVAHQSFGLQLGTIHVVNEYLAIGARSQEMIVVRRDLYAGNATIVDTKTAMTASRLGESLEHSGYKEIATVIDGETISSIGQHVAHLCIASLIDGIRLRT